MSASHGEQPQLAYDELSPSASIRLLRLALKDCHSKGVIHCELQTFELEKIDFEYCCVSYTWGPPFDGPGSMSYEDGSGRAEVAIRLHQAEFAIKVIGRNIFEFLSTMVHKDSEHWFWIDALCINQSNLTEKEFQVGQMALVFSKAAAVYTWLGVEDESIRQFADIHDQYGLICQRALEKPDGVAKVIFNKTRETAYCSITGQEITEYMARSVISFFARRRYFRRAWTVQEFVLAKPYFILGERSLDLEKLNGLAWWIIKNGSELTTVVNLGGRGSDFDKKGAVDLAHNGLVFLANLPDLNSRRLRGGLTNDGNMMIRLHTLYGALTSKEISYALLEDLLWRTKWQQASDPRDYIFSLLGLVVDSVGVQQPDFIKPDYRVSAEEVFRTTAIRLLTNLPHLTTLAFLNGDDCRDDFGMLPSWCPIWGHGYELRKSNGIQFRHARHKLGGHQAYDAYPARNEENSQLRIEGNDLKLHASYVDDLSTIHVHSLPSECSPSCAIDLLTLRSAIDHLETIDGLYPTHPVYKDSLQAVVEGILGGSRETGKSLVRHIHDYKERLLSTLSRVAFNLKELRMMPSMELADELEVLSEKCLAILDRQNGARGLPTRTDIESKAQKLSNEQWPPKDLNSGVNEVMGIHRTYVQQLFVGAQFDLPTFMHTSKGFVGITVKAAKPGDQLWLPCRGRAPLVLRPLEDKNVFSVVGEAYLQGAMAGEFVENGLAAAPQLITLR